MSSRSRRRARQQAALLDPEVMFTEPGLERVTVEQLLAVVEVLLAFYEALDRACADVRTALSDLAARVGVGDEPEQADEEGEVRQPDEHDAGS